MLLPSPFGALVLGALVERGGAIAIAVAVAFAKNISRDFFESPCVRRDSHSQIDSSSVIIIFAKVDGRHDGVHLAKGPVPTRREQGIISCLAWGTELPAVQQAVG